MISSDVIAGFNRTVLSSRFDNPVESPEFHKEMWNIFCSTHNKVAIAAPRAHAKTTGGTIAYTLASVLFRERTFVIIVSDTEAQAIMFLNNIKDHLANNEALYNLFDLKRNEKGVVEFAKDTESDIIVTFGDGEQFRIIAKGAEQKLRGLNWLGKRPDLIMCDDMENDELVMNKDRREKMKHWFDKALIPCLSRTGIIRVVGTVMHTDSLLENMMPVSYSKWTHKTPLKMWSEIKRGGWMGVKYRAHSDDFKHILWPQQYSASFFIEKKAEFDQRGMSDGYSQEFLNVPIDETNAYFRRKDFLEMPSDAHQRRMSKYITVDLAISKEERADYSVFLVAGVDEAKNIHIIDVIRDRLDGREIVDTLIALQRKHDPDVIGIEEMQVSKSIGPFLREEMVKTGVFINVLPLKHGGKDKIARARSIQARLRTHTVYFDKTASWYAALEDECAKFPRDAHDDTVDALAYLGMLLNNLIEAPTQEEEEDELYERELQLSGGEQGRSSWCGY